MSNGYGTGVVVRIELGHDRVVLAADVLWQAGPTAVEEQPGPGGGAVLVAGFAAPADGDRAVRALADAGHRGARVVAVDDDGRDGWRAWADVERAGPFSLVPTWVKAPEVPDGQFVVRLDPGRAFGSGSHPTTRATLAALSPLVGPHTSVLDVGCGSGVLAIAAAMLGAAPVVAIDVDPDAVVATASNASVNRVDRRIQVTDRAISDLVADGHCFDVVAANLLAPVFEKHGRELVHLLAPGGHLVASGLLADNWRRTVDALAPLAVVDLRGEQGWVALTLTSLR